MENNELSNITFMSALPGVTEQLLQEGYAAANGGFPSMESRTIRRTPVTVTANGLWGASIDFPFVDRGLSSTEHVQHEFQEALLDSNIDPETYFRTNRARRSGYSEMSQHWAQLESVNMHPYTAPTEDQIEEMLEGLADNNAPIEEDTRRTRRRRNEVSQSRNIVAYTGRAGMESFEAAMTAELERQVAESRAAMENISILPAEYLRGEYVMGIDPITPIEDQESITTTQYYNALPRLEEESDLDYLDRLSSQD